jgi:hypothetical protein
LSYHSVWICHTISLSCTMISVGKDCVGVWLRGRDSVVRKGPWCVSLPRSCQVPRGTRNRKKIKRKLKSSCSTTQNTPCVVGREKLGR